MRRETATVFAQVRFKIGNGFRQGLAPGGTRHETLRNEKVLVPFKEMGVVQQLPSRVRGSASFSDSRATSMT